MADRCHPIRRRFFSVRGTASHRRSPVKMQMQIKIKANNK
jgi:hypothetical protein